MAATPPSEMPEPLPETIPRFPEERYAEKAVPRGVTVVSIILFLEEVKYNYYSKT